MKVGIVGLGYVGLPLAVAFAEAGGEVVTAQPEIDYERVVAEAPLVLDFRGTTRGIEASHLVRL